ncbi:outer dense fiber protein 3-like [Thrips palmi]|uniref:Outer dense fiber protein 3-like n=1 Tax=Thrips palmi TaxID=161013 RepID=A0A6P8Z346_THRPL|nr:outer dense fiber protein 3-like [Thrips palmi]
MPKTGCNKNPGPGPGAYLLPSTVGFDGHDTTRDRQPAYSIGRREAKEAKSLGPGPDCMVDKYNRFGPTTAPAYTMAPHLKPLTSFQTPGPGQYYPEKYAEKAAAFSLLQRLPTQGAFQTPPPNAYVLPSCLNGTIEHLGQRLSYTLKDDSPGPARYQAPALDVSRWRMPQYSMAHRTPMPGDRSQKPAPNAYLPQYNTHRSPPHFSFGVKHTDCEFTPLTDEDKYPPGCP